MLALRDVSVSTGPPRFLKIFDDLTLDIPHGSNTVIYGENGSGKSTLVMMLLGEVLPDSGKVTAYRDIAGCYFEDIDSQLFFSSVSEEIETFKVRDKEIEALLIDKLVKRNILELSYSEKARLAFASAHALGRDYLIVDAPPVDEKISAALEIIQKRGGTAILMLLPEGDTRPLDDTWKKYIIKDKKLCSL